MSRVIEHTELDAPADVVWSALSSPAAFVLVANGMIRFPAAERALGPWREGDVVEGWTFLFGVLPWSRHHLRLHAIDATSRTLESREHGGLVRRWDHTIVVTPLGARRCRYEDRIEIDAGVLTPVVVAFARVFYRYRQRNWRQLARVLETADIAGDRRVSAAAVSSEAG